MKHNQDVSMFRRATARARARYSFPLVLAFLACLAAPVTTSAQNVRHTKNSVNLGLRSPFQVNPATNALEMEIPLGASSYPQRGGDDVAPAINYSSKIWRMAYVGATYTYYYSGNRAVPQLTATLLNPKFGETSNMGWTFSLAAPALEPAQTEYYDAWGKPVSQCIVRSADAFNDASTCCYIDRMRVRMGDGSTHELRSSDKPHCYDAYGNAPPTPDNLYSTDGSRLRYQRSTNRLYLPDGSYWGPLNTSAPPQHFDRNGNLLLNGSQDGLGRTFANPLNVFANGTDYSYTVPGVGGAPLTYTFRWRYLSEVLTEQQPLPNYTDDCDNCTAPFLFTSELGGTPAVRVVGGANHLNPLVLHQVVLPHDPSDPDPPTYTFTYNTHIEIDKVVYPTGGYERFRHGLAESPASVYDKTNRGVTDRWVSARGDGTDEAHWQYTWTDEQGQLRRGEISPDGTRTERMNYYSSVGEFAWSYADARAGRPREERVFNAAGQMIRRKVMEWTNSGSDNCFDGGAYNTCTATRNPRLTKEVEIIIEPGVRALAKITTYGYDLTHQYTTGVNQTSVNEYDHVPVDLDTAQNGAASAFNPPSQPLRKTETAYLDATNAAYRARHILGLPTSVEVRDGAGALVSKTTTAYDEPDYQLVNNYGSVANWVDPGSLRGNATTVSRWLNTTGGYLQTHAQYDQLGNVVASWDANGNQTQIDYSSVFGFAYPTSVTTAAPNPASVPNPDGGPGYGAGTFGSASGFTSHTDYDPSTGLVISTTDANNNTTTYNYADPLNRLKSVTGPDGGTTSYEYGRASNAGRVSDYVLTASALDSARSVTSLQFFDGLGRPARSLLSEGGSPVLYLTTDTQYDAVGRAWRVSSPYRTTGASQPINPSGAWTTTEYDALGRVSKTTTADGARVQTDYDGVSTLVTDEADRQRMSRADALGRLVEVWEIKAADPQNPDPWLESVTFPQRQGVPAVGAGYRTSYTYDALGNLRTVSQPAGAQAGQTRTFVFDSLSRLTSSTNPESGTVSYTYDANGNLLTRTDARGVQTSHAYDGLNRNIITSYANITPDTPTVIRKYDFAVNGKGLPYLTQQAGPAASATYIDEYDDEGRPLVQRQRFETGGAWGADYKVTRTYDLAGNVLTQTYPSGHTVAYNYDAAGRIGDNGTQPAFTGNLGDGVARTYASAVTYGEFGIQQERFGTQVPLYHKMHYNRRGQLYDIRLSTLPLAADRWNWNRGALINYYSSNYAWEGNPNTPGGADNNGNVLRQQHWVPSDDQISGNTYTQQTYGYDALNRLSSVTEAGAVNHVLAPDSFRQAYDYDRWGNRTVNAARTSGAPEPQFELQPPPATREVAEPSNRIYAPGDAARLPADKLMRYDAAGNLVHDAYTGSGPRVYDAENRMTAAYDNTGNWASYAYDADGRRVRRSDRGEETWQVYGMDGELLAEYRSGAGPFLPSKEYGYRGDELLVTMSSGDDRRLKRFVTYLYYGALQRDPTPQELQEKVNQLASAGAQGQAQLQAEAAQVARSLFTSTGYETSTNRSDRQYVADLYYAYLQRAPDDGGLDWWTGQVAWGREHVCNAFQGSGEFQAVVSTLYGSAASDDQRTETFVHRLYLGAYGRAATSTELQQQRDALNAAAAQGVSQVQAQAEAIGRSLFASQVGDYSITNQQYVVNLYEGFLHRGPDTGGMNFWTSIADSHGRQLVLDSFATSPAFRELSETLFRETSWLVPDHLGTPRMIADKTGSLAGVKRHDYLPFGEELFAGTGGRSVTQGYSGPDTVRQKFTSKERDAETALDYFLARYYSPSMGRFTSPDEYTGGPTELFAEVAAHNPTFYAELAEPQSLNKYHYALNNPLRYVDPDGHQTTTADRIKSAAWETAKTIGSAAVGVGRGVGASLSMGTCQACNPSEDDTVSSRVGQAIGTGLVMGHGGGNIIAGGVETGVSGGSLLLTGVPELQAVIGSYEVLGAGQNAMRLLSTPMRMSNNSGGGRSQGGSPNSGGAAQPKQSKVSPSTSSRSIGGRFTETRKVKPGNGPGQSRAEYVSIRNSQGKVIRTYKDSYDRANRFRHRKPLRGGPEGRPQN